MQGHQDFLVLPQARLNLASYSHLSAKLTEPQSALAGREYTEFVWSINKPKPAKKFIIPGVRFDPPKLGTFFFFKPKEYRRVIGSVSTSCHHHHHLYLSFHVAYDVMALRRSPYMVLFDKTVDESTSPT